MERVILILSFSLGVFMPSSLPAPEIRSNPGDVNPPKKMSYSGLTDGEKWKIIDNNISEIITIRENIGKSIKNTAYLIRNLQIDICNHEQSTLDIAIDKMSSEILEINKIYVEESDNSKKQELLTLIDLGKNILDNLNSQTSRSDSNCENKE